MIKNIFLVGLGGALGSVARFTLTHLNKSISFPYATLFINITGSLLIGMIIGLSLKENGLHANWKIFLSSGLCGGFTTFSAFSFENMQLIQQGKWMMAMLYILCSVALGIAGAFLGFKLSM